MFKQDVSHIAKIKRQLALKLALFSERTLKLMGRKATSFPGKLALKIYPQMLEDIVAGRCLLVLSGTNGKSTCSFLVAEILREAGIAVIHNSSGANMADGLVSTALSAREDLANCHHLVFEVDEAWFSKLASSLSPQYLALTNLFQDQVDRNGDVAAVRAKLLRGIEACPELKLILNADDPDLASLVQDCPRSASYFALLPALTEMTEQQKLEDVSSKQALRRSCPLCAAELNYSYRNYADLGKYHCEACGLTWPQPEVFIQRTDNGFTLCQEVGEVSRSLYIERADLEDYQLYNFAAAALAALKLGADLEDCASVFRSFKSIPNRNQELDLGEGREVKINLVKNPVGLSLALENPDLQNANYLLLAINNKESDGRDFSWLEEVDYTAIYHALEHGQLKRIILSGACSSELFRILKDRGLNPEMMELETDIKTAVNLLCQQLQADEKAVILPNYTAMLELPSILE